MRSADRASHAVSSTWFDTAGLSTIKRDLDKIGKVTALVDTGHDIVIMRGPHT